MRILHVNKFLYRRGGAESYMLDLADMQRTEGHEVVFFSMQHPDNLDDDNADLFAPRMELNPPPETVRERVATAAGVVWRRDARIAMTRMVDRVRPDVAHLHNIYHQLSPSILRPLAAARIPTVMTLHDYKLVCPTYQFLDHGQICEACLPSRFHQATLRRCNRGSLSGSVLATVEASLHRATGAYDPVDVLICPSAFMRQKMLEGGIGQERLVHVPHYCDLTAISPATNPGRGVVFAGRLSPEKGVDVLIDACANLMPGLEVTIAGDGPDRVDLEKRATERGVADRVRFLGRVPGATVHSLMRHAAVVVVPSRWYENQPMTILEAFGAARPVVATRLGGMPELIEDGVTGRLVPHDDPTALAAALNEVAGDPAGAHRMGLLARGAAEVGFAPDRHLDNIRAAYESAAQRKSAR